MRFPHKITALMLVAFIQVNANACMVPYSGPEYDQLIQVSEIDGKNRFKVVLPRRLGDLQVRYVGLRYLVDDDKLKSEFPNVLESHQDIFIYTYYDLFFDWITFHTLTELEAEFEAKYIDGHVPIVTVSWWPWSCCPCSAHGNSGHLKVTP